MGSKYYSLKKILKENATYNMIIGERSNGKTYSVFDYCLEDFFKNGNQLGYIRRWDEDFKGKRGQVMFDAIVSNGLVKKYSGNAYTGIKYFASKWYPAFPDEKTGKLVAPDNPFAYGFSLNTMEHDKSTAYPNIRNIFFDEFITRGAYLVDEFVTFANVISTIVRDRDDVKIFMCANTVNKFCPYFKEMGITHIEKMKQGTIDVYTYGASDLKVAVEYCDSKKEGKKSDKYFAFDNPKLNMITGGAWEINIYPHLPEKYTQKQIEFTYFIVFNNHILQCEVVQTATRLFTFVHEKTSPLKYPDTEFIYGDVYDGRPNWRRRLSKPLDDIDKKLYWFFKCEKVFYADNEVGELMRNYINWCNTDRGWLN